MISPEILQIQRRLDQLQVKVEELESTELDRVLTAEEIMEFLNIKSKSTLYKAIHDEGLPARKRAGYYRCLKSDLVKWIGS